MDQQIPSPTISITESLSRAWAAVLKNVWLLMGFTFIYFVGTAIVSMIPLVSFVLGLFGFIYTVSIYSAFQKTDQGGELSFNDFFNWSPRFGKLFTTQLVIFMITIALGIAVVVLIFMVLGLSFFTELASGNVPEISSSTVMMLLLLFLACFVLTFIFFVFTFATLYLAQYREMSLSENLSLSWKIGKNNIGQLLLFVLLAIGLSILGFLALGVGIFVATPLIVGTQYYFLRSMFPDAERQPEWDFMKTGQ